MKNKLPCELIQDLFPSYIDGLTSEVTNAVVEEHIADCDGCRDVLKEMKAELEKDLEQSVNSSDKQGINFLKKTKKRTHRVIIGSILAVIFIFAGLYFAKTYLIGEPIYTDAVDFELKVQNGNQIAVRGMIKDERFAVASVKYTEEEGIVTICFNGVKASPFSEREIYSHYMAQNDIIRICVGERIVWEKGKPVSEITSRVFNSRHPYIGDVSQNGITAGALDMGVALGNFTNELQTDKEPYGWKIILEEELAASERAGKERIMKAYSYIILAVIDNLGEMSFEYTVDGETCSVTVTEEEASEFADRDIKECGQHVLLLQELIEKAKIYGRLYEVGLQE